jgi:hypothetical protein
VTVALLSGGRPEPEIGENSDLTSCASRTGTNPPSQRSTELMKTCKSLARAMEWVADVSFLIYTVLALPASSQDLGE